MHISYDTKGICAAKIDFDLEEGKVYNLKFNSGWVYSYTHYGCNK